MGRLVLGRKVGEEIVVEVPPLTAATTIRIAVSSYEMQRGSMRFRVVVDAPTAVRITRSELLDQRGQHDGTGRSDADDSSGSTLP